MHTLPYTNSTHQPHQPHETLRPRLKRGVTITTDLPSGSSHFYIGTPLHGLRSDSDELRQLLSFLDGNHEIEDIVEVSGLSRQSVEKSILELRRAHLVDTYESQITLYDRNITKARARALASSRSVMDATYARLQERIRPELSLTTWREGVEDGGVALISARQFFDIEISGISRIAPILYSILLASGVSQTRLVIEPRGDRSSITASDIAGGHLHAGDIGLPYFQRNQEYSKDCALFPPLPESEMTWDSKKVLRIHFGEIDLESTAQWLQSDLAHLIVNSPQGGHMVIGPLVIPMKTPCHRCAQLTYVDRGWVINGAEKIEVPAASAHLVAGYLADQIVKFIDSQSCDLVGRYLSLNLLTAGISQPQLLERHPLCGCGWSSRS